MKLEMLYKHIIKFSYLEKTTKLSIILHILSSFTLQLYAHKHVCGIYVTSLRLPDNSWKKGKSKIKKRCEKIYEENVVLK